VLPIGKIHKTNNLKFKLIYVNIVLRTIFGGSTRDQDFKDYKTYCEHHPRKISKAAENEDFLYLLIVSSDTYVSLLRNITK